jgi:putative DNA primase/helicase
LKGGIKLVYKEFIDTEKYPRKNAEIADSHETFDSCGWILKDHEVVVDIDSLEKPKIEKIISLFNIKTQIVWTARGAHFYFKKPTGFKGSKKICPLGFEVEYKHSKNTTATTIKQNGELRLIENEGIREDLPAIFYSRKRLESLLGMDENDGRNNKLFAHRMKIHEIENWQSILRFVNNHVFATALPEEEFQVISRDVQIEVSKNNEPEVAENLMARYKVISYLGKLYFRRNDKYIQDDERLVRLIFDEVGSMKTRYVKEVVNQMELRAPIIEADQTFDIKLQNGILRNGRFIPIEYQEFTPYSIDIPYDDEAAAVPIVDDYINHLTKGEPEYKMRLLEIMAHPLVVDREFKRLLAKFFIMVGGGGNGKGTFLLIMRRILGTKNCSGLSIKQMVDERYFGTLQNKLVNLGDDVQDEAINNEQMKVLKNISTCDFVASRNLFEMSKDIELTLSLIFTSNHILKSFEKGDSYKRRVDWLPIFSKPSVKDKNFIKKVTTPEALKYWVKMIVEGYMRLYENQGFTESPAVAEFNEKYHEMNNNCTEFLQDFDPAHFIGKRAKESYEEYIVWAEENGLNEHSKRLFQDSMEKVLKLEMKKTTKNGKSVRCYMPIN